MCISLFARILAQPQSPDHAHPHLSFRVHVLGSLLCRHGKRVQPVGNSLAASAVILQHQFLFHRPGCISAVVERFPYMRVQLAGMSHESTWLYYLQVTGLFKPQITEYVVRSLQQRGCFFRLSLFCQQLYHQHGGLLHRDVHVVGKAEFLQQHIQRVLLGAVEWGGRCQKSSKQVLQVGHREQPQLLQLAGLSFVDDV